MDDDDNKLEICNEDEGQLDEDDDKEDEGECDVDRYVPFEDKILFSERLKQLTNVVHI